MKRLTALIAILLLLVTDVAAQKRTRQSVQKQQQQTERQIRQTNQKLQEKNRRISNAINDLGRLQVETEMCNKSISLLNHRIDSINAVTRSVNDSISYLDGRLMRMRESFAKVLRDTRRSRTSMGNIAFVFSSGSFTQAYRRMRALGQFSKWRERKAREISEVMTALQRQRNQLDSLKGITTVSLAQLSEQKETLRLKQSETNGIVKQLKGEQRQLKKVLDQQNRQMKALDDEINRIIEEERKAAEEAARKKREEEQRLRQIEIEKQRARDSVLQSQSGSKPSVDENKKTDVAPKSESKAPEVSPVSPGNESVKGKFSDNKGRLSYPVEGRHVIVKRFGIQKHPSLKYVKTTNNGIDIQTEPSATVRSVFDGEVIQIFRLSGFNTAVMISHGDYLTVYSNLASASVRKGDRVTRNQPIGVVYADPANDNRSILHFEIRNLTKSSNNTENPELWLR